MKNVGLKTLSNLIIKAVLGFIGSNLISINPCIAQTNITPDNSLGNEASQITPDISIKGVPSTLVEGGAKRGQNLFHSFSEFNIDEQRGAYFLVPDNAIQNVLTRVTGNNPSNILGILGTISDRNFSSSNANLFLINPNGIVFGQNASLDLNGSFVGTTANAVEFGETGLYSATNPLFPSELLTVAPGAFLFSQINKTASIQNNSVADVGLNPSTLFTPRGLRVANGKSLLLLGGDINFDGGGLVALGGRVELGGYSDIGTVNLNQDGNNLSLSFDDDIERSDITLSNGAGVLVNAVGDGNIAVNARNLGITQQSQLLAGIAPGFDFPSIQAGNIDINVTEKITSKNDSFIRNLIPPQTSGQGGDINVNTNSLQLETGAQIGTVTLGIGKGGNLTVNARQVQLSGRSENNIGRNADTFFVTALGTVAQEGSTGDAGNLNIKTDTLLVKDGAAVFSGTFSEGRGGNLSVEAQNIQLIGESPDSINASTLSASTQQNATGDAGNLIIKTNNLLITDGAAAFSGTFGRGNGGNLTVDAEYVKITGETKGGLFPTAIATSALPNSAGNAGDLYLKTDILILEYGGQVSTTTFSSGKGGNLTVEAGDTQLISESKIFVFSSGLLASSQINSSGDAGTINLTTGGLLITDGAIISVSSQGAGKGNNLTINADNLQITDGSRITALSQQVGTAGDIDINVKNNFNAANDTFIITKADESKGGNINITAGKNIILRNNSDIRTELNTTDSSGGDITLNANAIIALEDSDIFAFATEGRGGNITFNTRAFLSDPLYRPTPQTTDKATVNALNFNNRVDVNASGGTSTGNISGLPDTSFLQDSLTELAENFIDREALVASTCVVRTNQTNGTFFITGQSNLPYRPGDAISSQYSAVEVQRIKDDIEAKPIRKWEIGDSIVEPSGIYRLANGKRVLSRECGK